MSTMDSSSEATRVALETTITAAMFVGSMAWLAHATIAGWCVWNILSARDRRARHWLWIVCPLFALATTSLFAHYDFYLLAFVKERSYPDGPLAFWAENQAHPSAVCAFAGGMAAFTLGYAVILYRYYSLQPKHWFIRFSTCALFVVMLIAIREHVLRVQKHLANPPAWNAFLAETMNFIGIYRMLLLELFSVLATVPHDSGAGLPFMLRYMTPANKVLSIHYTAILLAATPIIALSMVGLGVSFVGLWAEGARAAQFITMTVAVQLAALCAEVLISWTVQPPQVLRDALDDATMVKQKCSEAERWA